MHSPHVRSRRAPAAAGAVVLLAFLCASAVPVQEIHLHDTDDNALLRATLQYSGGVVTQRDVYAPDGYFMRTVAVRNGAGSQPAKDSSLNFDGRLVAYGTYSYSGGKVTYQLVDDGRPEMAVTYDAALGQAEYVLSNTGGLDAARVSYTYGGDGTPISASILDAAGTVLYRADFSSTGVDRPLELGLSRATGSLQIAAAGEYLATFTLARSGPVSIRAFDLSGRAVAQLFRQRLPAGSYSVLGTIGGSVRASALSVIRLETPAMELTKRVVCLGAAGPARPARVTRHAGGSVGRAGAAGKGQAAEAVLDARAAVSPAVILELLWLNGDIGNDAHPRYLNPTDIEVSPDGALLYVAEERSKRVGIVATDSRQVLDHILLPNEPTGLVLSSDGATLYVTCSSSRWPNGIVCEVSTTSQQVVRQMRVGYSARMPVLSHDESTLYTCNQFVNTVSQVDLASGAEVAVIPVVREPYAAGLSPDGNTLIVTNSLPVGEAAFEEGDTITALVSFIDTRTRQVTSTRLTDGSHSMHGVAFTSDGQYAFVTHVVGRYQFPANKIEGGWINSNNISVIDVAARKVLNVIDLDDATHGVANPWDLEMSADGTKLCVTHAGSAEITVVDVPGLLAKIAALPPGTDLTRDLTFASSVKTRVPLSSDGARAVVMHGKSIYIANYFSDDISYLSLDYLSAPFVGTIDLGGPQTRTQERYGELSFYDAKLCYQNWQSCHSCHPFTRPDMLNWDLLKDGVGNPRNAKSMLWAHRTPPAHADGGRATAHIAVDAGVRYEQFTEPSLDRLLALDTFLHYMKPFPSPELDNGKLTATAQRGKQIFSDKSRVDCAYCHPAPLYTDLRLHAGLSEVSDLGVVSYWDTPTLVESWRTAPYSHDGRYATMADVLKVSWHTNASRLPQEDFEALLEYVLSL